MIASFAGWSISFFSLPLFLSVSEYYKVRIYEWWNMQNCSYRSLVYRDEIHENPCPFLLCKVQFDKFETSFISLKRHLTERVIDFPSHVFFRKHSMFILMFCRKLPIVRWGKSPGRVIRVGNEMLDKWAYTWKYFELKIFFFFFHRFFASEGMLY